MFLLVENVVVVDFDVTVDVLNAVTVAGCCVKYSISCICSELYFLPDSAVDLLVANVVVYSSCGCTRVKRSSR